MVVGSCRNPSAAGKRGIRKVNVDPGNERACKLNRNLGLILEVVFRELKILFRNEGLEIQLTPSMYEALSSVLSTINKRQRKEGRNKERKQARSKHGTTPLTVHRARC